MGCHEHCHELYSIGIMLQHGDNETSISDYQASNDKTQQHTCNYRHTKRYCIRGTTLERSAEMTTGVSGIAGGELNYFLHDSNLALNSDSAQHYEHLFGPYIILSVIHHLKPQLI